MKVHKAVIPVAGFGTRMLPAAKALPKELLPILDRPTIQYVAQEAADAGLDDLLLVTSRDKRAIEDHFDRSAELESRLAASGKQALLRSLRELMNKIKIHSVRQPEQHGLGDAVNQARRFAGDQPFLCMLGDTLFSGDLLPATQMVRAAEALGTAVIGLEEVAPDKVNRYGIVAGELIGDGLLKITGLVEKPTPASAPSRLAIAARYILTPDIFDCLDQTPRGTGNEIQLTDALRILLQRRPIHGVILKARRHDIGNLQDWLATNLIFAARDPALWKELRPLLDSLPR
ncbi:MAG: UTP--glucose-1-phosphate uridylyltransferase [Planctomycetota bacterium]|nr:UTP--glucose-1-phosphate uridylyltransferase [Planctomycetota bacterium]